MGEPNVGDGGTKSQILRKCDRNHLDIEVLLRNPKYLAKKMLTKCYTFSSLRAHKGRVSAFHKRCWRVKAAEKQGRNPEPLAHPISCGVEFESRFGLQTFGVDKVKLVNETGDDSYVLSIINNSGLCLQDS